jgi:site-specific recombinase XerC
MEPWQPARRGSYRQKTEQRVPRAIPDELYDELFGVLCRDRDRDRAIVSLLVSSGARAAELLGMTARTWTGAGHILGRMAGHRDHSARLVAGCAVLDRARSSGEAYRSLLSFLR